MKSILATVLLLASSSLHAQQVTEAESISPKDFGAYKWILSGTGNDSEVVIFRTTTITIRGEKEGKDVYDTVCYSANKDVKQTVFFFNPEYFCPNEKDEPQWHFKAMGATGVIQGEFNGYKSSSNKAEIEFISKKFGTKQKIFEVLIISYKEAKISYPELPEIKTNQGWTWAGSPK